MASDFGLTSLGNAVATRAISKSYRNISTVSYRYVFRIRHIEGTIKLTVQYLRGLLYSILILAFITLLQTLERPHGLP
jgi:hypothetical protein